jgi:VIT1/CCC1 family predicted Fe2+/Mn2+ transporter
MKRELGNHTQQKEMHRSGRAGWLRAAVLGSDDAIVSTASLMIGVAAASASKGAILVAGVAGLFAGAMSMAVGEYVSVSSQRDAEQADVGREKGELAAEPEMIYVKRGLEKDLAMKVAEQLSAHDRLGAHMRDELGIDQAALARPLQAAWISAASFALFAVVPIAALLVAPASLRIPLIAVVCLVSLAALGAFGGYLGGAPLGRATLRVTLGGALAMAVTALIGRILGVSVG